MKDERKEGDKKESLFFRKGGREKERQRERKREKYKKMKRGKKIKTKN